MQRWSKKDIVRDELIGKYIRIESSNDPTQVGMSGWIVDETRNTMRIETAPTWNAMYPKGGLEPRVKCIAKKGTVVDIYRSNVDEMNAIKSPEPIRLDLVDLMLRPEDRNKRLKKVR